MELICPRLPPRLRRRGQRIIAHAALAWLALLVPMAEAEQVALDVDRRDHLGSLEPVRGAPLLADRLEGKVVVLSFFASWCPPCRTEMHQLDQVATEIGNVDLVIAAINVFENYWDADPERLERFLDDVTPSFPVLKGTEATRLVFGPVDRIPTVLVFGRDGRSRFDFVHRSGAASNPPIETLRSAIAGALAEAG